MERDAFLDRESELALLEHWWSSGQPELITLHGRRQVGKTELLVRFLAGKRAIYFYADRQPVREHMLALTEQVLALHDDAVLRLQPFASWEACLTYVLRLAEQERIVFAIDEFSYAVDSDPSLPSVLQRLWDHARRFGSQACILLCTSFTEAVERHFRIDAPLYLRRTRELRLEPFTYEQAALFFPRWSAIDKLTAWGVVGGVPSYLAALRGATLSGSIVENVLRKSAPLYREAEVVLAQEVRGIGPTLLRGILQAIAHGCTEPNQISQRVGRPVTAISGALGFLVDYGLIRRRVPYSVRNPERTRQSKYTISDNYLAFWFRFVLPNRSMLEQGQARSVWERKAAPQLNDHMGARFEAACRQFIRLHPELWANPIVEIGSWWRADDELDIVGHIEQEVMLAAEVKWTERPVGLEALATLEARVGRLSVVSPLRQLALFSKAGFTPEVRALAGPRLLLFTLRDMLPFEEARP